jgi:hypothetical protein
MLPAAVVAPVILEHLLVEILVLMAFLEREAHQMRVVLVVHVITAVMRLERMELHQDLVVAVAQLTVVLVVMGRLVLQYLVVRFEQVVAH